jgi:hypothetical protein
MARNSKLGKIRNGYYRLRKGKEKLLDGTERIAAFWLGNDAKIAKDKMARIDSEWIKVTNAGHTVWPDEVLHQLAKEGVINKRFITKETASKIIGKLPQDAELEPFKDEKTGLIKTEYAYSALEKMVQKLLTLPDYQSKFVEAFQRDLVRDPVGTVYRAAQQFGWGKGEASSTINILNSNTLPPIAFDASEAVIDIPNDPPIIDAKQILTQIIDSTPNMPTPDMPTPDMPTPDAMPTPSEKVLTATGEDEKTDSDS